MSSPLRDPAGDTVDVMEEEQADPDQHPVWPWWQRLLLGQALSLGVALTAVFSALLDDRGVSLPAFQLVGTYTLLAGVYLPSLAVQLRRGKRLSAPAWAYFVISFIDVQANFCMVLAYRFTSVTSVMLLSNWTIPCVMAFSFVALKRRYGRQHLLGAAICVTGLTLLVLSDNRDGGSGSALGGDMLALLGATLYAGLNVAQEAILGSASELEYLGAIGLGGFLVSGVQCLALEGPAMAQMINAPSVALYLGFVTALFLFYSSVPRMLVVGSATTLNLSLLTSDLWASVARVAVFGGFTSAQAISFAVSFAFDAAGLILYFTAPEHKRSFHYAPVTAAADGKDEGPSTGSADVVEMHDRRDVSDPELEPGC